MLHSSDLDLVVFYDSADLGSDGRFDKGTRESNIRILKRLKECLYHSTLPVRESIRLIGLANVPVLKWTERLTLVPVDISVNNSAGVDSSVQVNAWLQQYPALKPTTLVLKNYLWRLGLNDNYSGGIGSYLLVNLLVFLFQQQPTLNQSSDCCARALLSFLSYYGYLFNYREYGISTRMGKPFLLAADRRLWQSPRRTDIVPLVVEDPTDPLRDIGHSSFNVAAIFKLFKCDFEKLQAMMTPGISLPQGEMLGLLWKTEPQGWQRSKMDSSMANRGFTRTMMHCISGCTSFGYIHQKTEAINETTESNADEEE
ncbi:hypothetical protein SpCBS45565_g08509 [Spizellomyces sp. 'palustris']|nr:hypothetical protein SpCBS45565_g08509 [Spizellomyces sp. 'palustris']